MTRKIWTYIVLGALAWQIVRITNGALSEPWRWSLNQCLLIFLLACLLIVAVSFAVRWARYGRAAAWERLILPFTAMPTNRTTTLVNIGIWIVVALLLVYLFNRFE
jgi:hypothetical protein